MIVDQLTIAIVAFAISFVAITEVLRSVSAGRATELSRPTRVSRSSSYKRCHQRPQQMATFPLRAKLRYRSGTRPARSQLGRRWVSNAAPLPPMSPSPPGGCQRRLRGSHYGSANDTGRLCLNASVASIGCGLTHSSSYPSAANRPRIAPLPMAGLFFARLFAENFVACAD